MIFRYHLSPCLYIRLFVSFLPLQPSNPVLLIKVGYLLDRTRTRTFLATPIVRSSMAGTLETSGSHHMQPRINLPVETWSIFIQHIQTKMYIVHLSNSSEFDALDLTIYLTGARYRCIASQSLLRRYGTMSMTTRRL